MINYHQKTFRTVSNSANGEVAPDTIFHYEQKENIVTATYSGGDIQKGQLIAIASATGNLDMRYQHVNNKNVLMTGICFTTPEILPGGKIRLHEKWQWTSGDYSKGKSVVEEI